jgi:hypothetical protein
LVFMRIAPRQVCIAGFTPWPDVSWMKQMARNMTMVGKGMLDGGCWTVAVTCCTIEM